MSEKRIVILSGGAGTRLWPLSREAYPKQFHDLSGSGHSLIVDTLSRLDGMGSILFVTTESLKAPTASLLNRASLKADVVGEPQARNTAPAVLLATWIAFQKNPKTVLGVFPADHIIKNASKFRQVLERGFAEAEKGAVVTLGIHPDHPATGYGYMELESAPNPGKIEAMKVTRFLEKPSLEKAKELLATGKVAWNAGMFLFRADLMLDLFKKHLPEMHAAFEKLKLDLSNLKEVYAAVKPESVDVGIMEKIQGVVCMPADIGWSDVGSWEEISKQGKSLGRPLEVDGSNNFYTGIVPADRRVAFVGVSDLVAVDTPDALLIMKKGTGQGVKTVVEALKKESPALTKNHVFEERPWGRFEVLIDTEHFKSKRITVLPGQKLSYQSHAKRAEHWVIVRGLAEVVLNDVTHKLKAGDHIYIPLQAKHRIGNPGTEAMEFIEVQTGSYFGEDDIVRYSDVYGRNS